MFRFCGQRRDERVKNVVDVIYGVSLLVALDEVLLAVQPQLPLEFRVHLSCPPVID